MERRLMYVELKTGHDDDGPARIGWVGRSKTGHTLYYGDLVLRKLKGEEQSGFHVDDATGVRLPNSPHWLAKLAATAPLPFAGLRLGWELRCESSRRTLAGAELGGHAVSNLNLVTDALGEGIELSLGVHNLFDRRYAHPGADTNWQDALQQDGRNVRIALTARF